MQNLKVYLDTSIINFLYADDAPEYKKETERFFETILAPGKIDTFIPPVVTNEINDTKNVETRNVLLGTFRKYAMIQTLTTVSEEIARKITMMANTYLDLEIIPRHKIADAFHVAYATVFQMDILLSWNFRHLANINKEQKILVANKDLGFHYPFRMANPMEVVFDD
jgi:predicted nucleic acid-binding protein